MELIIPVTPSYLEHCCILIIVYREEEEDDLDPAISTKSQDGGSLADNTFGSDVPPKGRYDRWVTCDIRFFSTVFQSCQDGGWVIVKGSLQWKPVYG